MVVKRFAMNKLVRDRTVERQYCRGAIDVVKRTLDFDEYQKALKEKLFEEIQEIVNAQTVPEFISECADVFEVIESLLTCVNSTLEDVHKVQKEKRENRGGFSDRCFIESVVAPVDSELARYCKSYPDKYPELPV